MYHYVYTLYFPSTGMSYIGCHSTIIEPELDTCYLGSGARLPKDRSPQNCIKKVIKVFNTRKEATRYEEDLIAETNADIRDDYYNMRWHVHDKHGSHLSEEHKALISKTLKGRKRPEYAKKYKGEGRTPAQKAGSIRAGLKLRGTKDPRKGKPGVKNSAFKPWYYITPSGEYHEVYDLTLRDASKQLFNVSEHQLTQRFTADNAHKSMKQNRNSLVGYTFGFLPRPLDMDTE